MNREHTERTQNIRYVLTENWLGKAIIGIESANICVLFLGDSTEELIRALRERFPEQNLTEVAEADEPLATMALAYIAAPSSAPLPPLTLLQGTEFQQRVWHALQTIPHGQTLSYTTLATRIAAPRAVRAVAKACAANPIAVLVPCHRVLAKNGGLSGYRWGVERKAKLLAAERSSGLIRTQQEKCTSVDRKTGSCSLRANQGHRSQIAYLSSDIKQFCRASIKL